MEYYRNMVFLYLVDQKGNSSRICLRISGTARESRIIFQPVFLTEIAERETTGPVPILEELS